MPETPPRDEAPPTARERSQARRAAIAAAPRKRTKAKLALVAGGCVALVVGAVLYLKGTSRESHELSIDWPVGKPGGPVVAVGHDVKAGDAFAVAVSSDTGVVLGDAVDPMQGMKLAARMTWDHAIEAREGGGLGSTVTVRLDDARGTLVNLPSTVKVLLSGPSPLRYRLDREANGKPIAGTMRVAAEGSEGRRALEYLLCGLTDLTSNYLPAREVRLGETWDLAECATLGDIVDSIRFLATLRPTPDGFPKGGWKGSVGAEALEPRNGEPCVRLKLALEVRIDGDVGQPAEPGWISAIAKVEGSAWVSTSTGVLWAIETRGEVRSTYDVGRTKYERRAKQQVVGTTTRKS
jgi:hypothetical protein